MSQNNERNTRAKRGGEGGHRARSPRSREAQEVARNSAKQRAEAKSSAGSQRDRTMTSPQNAPTAAGKRSAGAGRNGRSGRSGDGKLI